MMSKESDLTRRKLPKAGAETRAALAAVSGITGRGGECRGLCLYRGGP